MSIEETYKTEADIPDALRSLYEETEVDGDTVFELQEDRIKTTKDTQKLKAALDSERKLRRDWEGKAGKAADLETKLQEKERLLKTMEDGNFSQEAIDKVVSEKVEATKKLAQQRVEDAESKAEALTQENTTLKSARDSAAIRSALETESKGLVREDMIEIFCDRYAKNFEIIEGKVLTKEDSVGKIEAVVDFVKAEVDKYRTQFGPESSGGGAKGGKKSSGFSGKNPFAEGTVNTTEASALANNPETRAEAMRLAKAAGVDEFTPGALGAIYKKYN